MLRKLGVVSQEGGIFATSIWAGWFLQLVLQIVVQPSYLADLGATRAPPELAAFAFGMNFMPAYLDSKGQELPNIIEPEYYGEVGDDGSQPNNGNAAALLQGSSDNNAAIGIGGAVSYEESSTEDVPGSQVVAGGLNKLKGLFNNKNKNDNNEYQDDDDVEEQAK